jgi:hypothetical protein
MTSRTVGAAPLIRLSRPYALALSVALCRHHHHQTRTHTHLVENECKGCFRTGFWTVHRRRVRSSPYTCVSPILNRPIYSKGVLLKLIIFSLSLGILPITSYFASQKYIWKGAPSRTVHPHDPGALLILCFLGDSTFAAITAVVAANVVLVAYIISSLREDQAERKAAKPSESRKDR